MENGKMPFLPEEAIRTQRVEVYLNDLKTRLKELRVQHEVVLQNSVQIINEIGEVSSSVPVLVENSVKETTKEDMHRNKIKKLIQEFEKAASSQSITAGASAGGSSKVNIQNILHNFEKLNESHVLKDCLVLFRRAKESFEKIDTFINNTEGNRGDYTARSLSTVGVSSDLRNKINMFNEASGATKDTSCYTSCCSLLSVDTFHSMDHIDAFRDRNANSTTSSQENGYDGDNDDSEYDLLAIKRKKGKYATSTSTDNV